jgi:class 3 adenylate cyclase
MATGRAETTIFLFTDIEGSTRLWEQNPEQMIAALARHDAILHTIITTHGGSIFKTVGDGVYATFDQATSALLAALAIQRTLAAEEWGTIDSLRVRIALHTGTVEARDGDYFGPPLNRLARLLATGHRGQTLLSGTIRALVCDQLPSDVILRDLGEHHLKDLVQPEHIFQLDTLDSPTTFPRLRTYNTPIPSLPTPSLMHRRHTGVSAVLFAHPISSARHPAGYAGRSPGGTSQACQGALCRGWNKRRSGTAAFPGASAPYGWFQVCSTA